MDWPVVIGTMVVVVGGGLAITLWWRRLAGADSKKRRAAEKSGADVRVVSLPGTAGEQRRDPGGASR